MHCVANLQELTMVLFFGFVLLLYCAIAFVFFTLSAMELLETGRGNAVSLSLASLSAIVWPLTVSVLTLIVFLRKERDVGPT